MMAEEKNKRKDWTKVDVKDIKEHLPKILLLILIILPIAYIGYLGWLGLLHTNTPDANSGVTTETKIYNANIGNKTLAPNKTGTVSDADFSNPTDLILTAIKWFPIIFGLYLAVKVFGFLRDND